MVAAALFGPLGLIGTAFWVWMIYDCIQNERDRQTWLWILIFLNIAGAFLYCISRWLPRASVPMPRFIHRWTRRDALWQAEADAKTIGKVYQYVKLGNILYDMGDRRRSAEAYAQALERDPRHPQALWGSACIAAQAKRFGEARPWLATLVDIDPDFKYGDASLMYGQVLYEMGDLEMAHDHLLRHLKEWSQPEAYMVLAKTYQKMGHQDKARDVLETMIIKVKSSAPFHYRQNRGWVRQGERMLRTLARG